MKCFGYLELVSQLVGAWSVENFQFFFSGSHVPLEDMLDELEIHLKLDGVHENVVNLIGVCSSPGGTHDNYENNYDNSEYFIDNNY